MIFMLHGRVFLVENMIFMLHGWVFLVESMIFMLHGRVFLVENMIFMLHGRVFLVHNCPPRFCHEHAGSAGEEHCRPSRYPGRKPWHACWTESITLVVAREMPVWTWRQRHGRWKVGLSDCLCGNFSCRHLIVRFCHRNMTDVFLHLIQPKFRSIFGEHYYRYFSGIVEIF